MRRMLVDEHGKRKCLLARGDRKSIQKDRVIIVPGPSAELEVVRWIFDSFVTKKMREREIARELNRCGIPNVVGKRWTSLCVRRVLGNERYIGNNVWNRTSGRLRTRRKRNHPDLWVRPRSPRSPSDEQMLKALQALWRKRGRLSQTIIDESRSVPSVHLYVTRFGSITRVYQLIGYCPNWYAHRPKPAAASLE